MKNLLCINDLKKEEIEDLINNAMLIKNEPFKFENELKNKTLLMIFEKPSLRTRISFEVGMTQLGGHAIYYNLSTSPLGKGKESIEDTAKTISRYVDGVIARVFEHKKLLTLAKNSKVPIINALSNFSHPCQVLSDLLTIKEKKGKIGGIKIAYLGDANNNVTTSLIFASSIMGMKLSIACPNKEEYLPKREVISELKNTDFLDISNDPIKAVENADVVYTDSWMSYHIKEEEKEKRTNDLKPFQVNNELMKHAKEDVIFMHCLPALRGYEVTSEVIDGPKSVVFDQAENRLHMQKAILIRLLNK